MAKLVMPRWLKWNKDQWCTPHMKAAEHPKENRWHLRSNRLIWILGGTGGIGQEIALELARTMQPTLVLSHRSIHDFQELDAELSQAGAVVHHLELDLSDTREIETAMATIHQKWGEINGVIHCAGSSHMDGDSPISWQEFQRELTHWKHPHLLQFLFCLVYQIMK